MKPSAVAVVLPNNAAGSEVSVTSAVPLAYPVLVVVIRKNILVPGSWPIMVTKPEPDGVAIRAVLKAS